MLISPLGGIQSWRKRFNLLTNYPATRYYVDATLGNDANDGKTPDLAWQTVAKVNGETFNPGESILFKRGETWREQLTVPSSGASGKFITFGAYGSGNRPIISGADIITGWTVDGGSYSAAVATEPHIVIYDGTVLTENDGATNTVGVNEWDWNANELWVNVGEDPDDGIAESGARDTVILLNSRVYVWIKDMHLYGANSAGDGTVDWNGQTGASNHVLSGLAVENGAGYGVRIYNSSNNTVRDCTISELICGVQFVITAGGQTATNNSITNNDISDCARTGIDVWGFDTTERATNHSITENTVANCGSAIYLHRCDSTTIANNTVLDIDSIAVGAEGLGVGVQTGSSNVIENNEIGRAWNRGIELWAGGAPDGPSTANIIRYNEIYDNGDQAKMTAEGGGIFIGADTVTNTQIYYNLIYDNDGSANFIEYGIFGTGTGHTIYNNVLYNNYRGIAPWEADADNWHIKNNIVMNSVQRHILAVAGVVADYDYNLYYPDGAAMFEWAGVTYNYAGWLLNSAQDGNSPVVADPVFVNPGADDFHLQAGSPARNVGTDVSLTRDYDEVAVPQETNPAIGAYEYVP